MNKIVLLLISFYYFTPLLNAQTNRISLEGVWKFRLDNSDKGIKEKWYEELLEDDIKLPGALQNQGYGNEVTKSTPWIANTNSKSKWFTEDMYAKYREGDVHYINNFQPQKHFVGVAWYQKEFFIPKSMKNEKICLHLERVHWQSQLWVNDVLVDSCYSLLAPHEYDISAYLDFGKKNRITLRVDNSMIVDVGVNAHSWGDQTMTSWNGIIGDIHLDIVRGFEISDLQIYPNVYDEEIDLFMRVDRTGKRNEKYILEYKISSLSDSKQIFQGKQQIGCTNGELSTTISMKNCYLWDEYDPNLYRLDIELLYENTKSCLSETFGMRELKTDDNRIWINNQERYLRGNVQCGSFPLTGYCAMDYETWERILLRFKDYGMNHVRFHSWCPPKAAFEAADKLGMYLFVEMGMWTGIKTDVQQDFIDYEGMRCLKEYGNHPSFIMMGMGNELSAKKEITNYLLRKWKKDKRHLYTGLTSSLSSITEEFEFVTNGFVRSNKGWPPRPQSSYFHNHAPSSNFRFYEAIHYPCPLFSHEVGQQCSYPALDQESKYVGSQRPAYLHIAKEQLQERGMLHQWRDFVYASGRLQLLMTKMEFESYRRTPKHSGFQLLQLEDFPGQGGALVGFMDYFYDDKGYTNASEFRYFNGDVVLLAATDKFTWTNDETLKIVCAVSNWASNDLKDKTINYRLINEAGIIVGKRTFKNMNIGRGDMQEVGEWNIPLSSFNQAQKLKLVAEIEGTDIYNHWEHWIYPQKIDQELIDRVVLYEQWNEEIASRIEKGEYAIIQLHERDLNASIPYCYLPVYWTQFDEMGNSQTMGLLCNPKHPLFKDFPTDSHTNYQWWELLNYTVPIQFDAYKMSNNWSKDFQPLIQLIDGWKTNRKLGVLAEAKYGKGKLIITSMDLSSELDKRVVARQMRYSLENYMLSDDFSPSIEVSDKQVEALLYKPAPVEKHSIIKEVFASTFERRYEAQHLCDSDKETIWHSKYSNESAKLPHEIILTLNDVYNVGALKYTPRQDQPVGRIKEYTVEISRDGNEWTNVTEGSFFNSAKQQEIDFLYFHQAKYIKLIIRSVWYETHAAIAELEVIKE